MGTATLERLRDRRGCLLSSLVASGRRVEVVWYPTRQSGGDEYERMVVDVLRSAPGLELREVPLWISGRRIVNLPSVASQIATLRVTKRSDVRVLTLDAALLRSQLARDSIVIVHHLDWSMSRYRAVLELLTERLVKRLALARRVVVVSDFWAEYLAGAGVRDVDTIYNAFEVDSYGASAHDIAAFRADYGFGDRPIVYLGKLGKGKGWRRALSALKGLQATLLGTGAPQRTENGHVCRMTFPARDYRIMLAASSVVVAMSEFDEGWCRVAHEGILSRTPVVGSGRGGMRELLVGGGQVVCGDFRNLRSHVVKLLRDPAAARRAGELGRGFAERFDTTRFQQSWLELVGKEEASVT